MHSPIRKKLKLVKSYLKENLKPFTDLELRLLKAKELHRRHAKRITRYKVPDLKRVKDSWRKPAGHQNKLRKGLAAKGNMPKIGRRSPRLLRGRSRGGYKMQLVYSTSDILRIPLAEKDSTLITFARQVGLRKRLILSGFCLKEGYHLSRDYSLPTSGVVDNVNSS